MWKSPRVRLVLQIFGTLIGILTLLFASVALDMTQVLGLILVLVFLSNLGNINSSDGIASLTAFMIFVFLRDLDLQLTRDNR